MNPTPEIARLHAAAIAFVDLPPATNATPNGETVLLIHGFASTHVVNWVGTSWTSTLTRAGSRGVAFDNRGHGRSQKFHDPADYDTRIMADDARALLDQLGIGRAHVMGYSMGARITAFLTLAHPDVVQTCLMGGLGGHLVRGVGLPAGIADAMEAPSLDGLTDPTQRMFRAFADANKQDLAAMAACIRGTRQTLTPAEIGAIRCPTLISIGTRDDIAGSAADLAAMIPGAEALDIPGRDHNLAVGDRIHKEGVLAFLAARR